MDKLNEALLQELAVVAAFEFMGGSCPLEYREWRRREALRSRRLLKFEGRRRARWDRTLYMITEAGRAALFEQRDRANG